MGVKSFMQTIQAQTLFIGDFSWISLLESLLENFSDIIYWRNIVFINSYVHLLRESL